MKVNMPYSKNGLLILAMMFGTLISCQSANQAKAQNLKTVSIKLAGNAFLTSKSGSDKVGQMGISTWRDSESTFSVFVKFDQLARVKVALRARNRTGTGHILVRYGDLSKEVEVSKSHFDTVDAGEIMVEKTGYSRFDLKGLQKTGEDFAEVSDLILTVPQTVNVAYVKDNQHNRFYWGRRGPSVHLAYELPENEDTEWLYSEVKVPKGLDPVGSYFEANGFKQGYFGIQVNGPDERRVLFSVWSPYKTDNPDDIPKDQRIQLLSKGEGVTVGKFGNEGSGGQSYWEFPWKAGKTYRFLNRVRPNGKGNTINTAFFYAPELGEWKLIASFKRPKTDSWLTGAYAFVENFIDTNGYKKREARFGNQWARDREGQWHEITTATFTGDDIANTGYRTDFAGGSEGSWFYLWNGGFKDGDVALGRKLERKASGKAPEIDFDKLPK